MARPNPFPFILLVATALVLMAGASEAQPARALRLRYIRGPGAADCPEETGLRRAVATHLGYDPFTADASNELSIVLSGTGQEIRAVLVLRNEAGEMLGEREHAANRDACADLVATVGLTTSMIVDRVGFPAKPLPAAARPRAAPAARPARTVPPDRDVDRLQGRAGFSTGVAVSDAAPAGVALGIQVGVQKGWLSAAIEVGTELPVVRQDNALQQDAYRFVGSVIPCVRTRAVFLCAVMGGGMLVVKGMEPAGPQGDRSAFFRFGGRAGVELRLTPMVSLEAYGDAMATFRPWAAGAGGSRGPATPSASGVIGAGVAARF